MVRLGCYCLLHSLCGYCTRSTWPHVVTRSQGEWGGRGGWREQRMVLEELQKVRRFPLTDGLACWYPWLLYYSSFARGHSYILGAYVNSSQDQVFETVICWQTVVAWEFKCQTISLLSSVHKAAQTCTVRSQGLHSHHIFLQTCTSALRGAFFF